MATVGLVSCVSRKRSEAAKAADLYDSALFKKARAYVESRCDRWYVLSAKYGLVDPQAIIEPYEETLNTKSRAERLEWANRVWTDLHSKLSQNDRVVFLAGERYRDELAPLIAQHGCSIEVPMEGLGIGRQLQWLSKQLTPSQRETDLERFYALLRRLEAGLGGKRLMSSCVGQNGWPTGGVYFFFEPGEIRLNGSELRVVRVGTHGVSRGSKATLWNRLRTHRGTGECGGNHRSSIFRLHVGAALAARDARLSLPTWGIGQAADADTRRREASLERLVSQHIGAMSVLWLSITDEAGPTSDRAYIERNAIGLVAGTTDPIDVPSTDWLGLSSPNERIRRSGLWNLDHLDCPYSREFLDVLGEYVVITASGRSSPCGSIAPANWHLAQRQAPTRYQPTLFGDQP